MEKRTLSFCCAVALTVWLFAAAFTSASGLGVYVGAGNEASEVLAVAATSAASGTAGLTGGTDTSAESGTAVLTDSADGTGATITTVTAASLPDMPTLSLACEAAVLIDQSTGIILYEYNADEARAVASITKVMTLLITFEAIQAGKISLDDIVPISDHAFSMGGSQIWLEPGETFTLEELIKAVCVSSANDAAVAIAEYVAGSEDAFVSMMNTRAAELGLTNTTYQNACGLDEENHLSSARDVAVLSCYILENCPEVLDYTGIWTDTLRDGATHLTNTNKLLNYYDGITGLKTGTTGDAGICITASATREGLSLVAVVLGSTSSTDRFTAAMTMLDYGFATFEAASVPLPTGDAAPTVQAVLGGVVEEVALDYSTVPETLLLTKGGGSALTCEVVLYDVVEAPVAAGAQLGTVMLYSDGALLAEYPITAAETVAKMTIADAMQGLWQTLCVA